MTRHNIRDIEVSSSTTEIKGLFTDTFRPNSLQRASQRRV
jgi:hypothetical protein